MPHVVKGLQLSFRPDEWKEHAELGAPHDLEETTEDVVVVQEIASTRYLFIHKWPL